eukprot:IDg22929t1
MSDAEENHRSSLENDDCKESCNELGVPCVVQNRVPEVKYLREATGPFLNLSDFYDPPGLDLSKAGTFYKTSDDGDTMSRPTMEFDLRPSSAVENYLGKRVAANTIRANETACRLFTDFCSSLIDKNPQKYACFLKFVSDRKQRMSSASCTDESFLIRLIFCNKLKSELLKSEDAGPVFSDPKQGLVSVLDNVFAEQQRSGTISRAHNVLSLEDLRVIFTHLGSVKYTPEGYRDRLVFAVGLATGLRPTALHTLTMIRFERRLSKARNATVFYEKLGGNRGESKTVRGGLRNVGIQQVTIPVPNRVVLSGLNIYAIIDEYIAIRRSLDFDSHRSLGIVGDGAAKTITTHGLRATMISLLVQADYDDSTVALRSGHRNLNSLKRYHNLKGAVGIDQLS